MTGSHARHQLLPAYRLNEVPETASSLLFCIELKSLATGYHGPLGTLAESIQHYQSLYRVPPPPVQDHEELFQHPAIIPYLSPITHAQVWVQYLSTLGLVNYVAIRKYRENPPPDTYFLSATWLRSHGFPRNPETSIYICPEIIQKVLNLGVLTQYLTQHPRQIVLIDPEWRVVLRCLQNMVTYQTHLDLLEALQRYCTILAFGMHALPKEVEKIKIKILPLPSWKALSNVLPGIIRKTL